jgi:hypothetical protein
MLSVQTKHNTTWVHVILSLMTETYTYLHPCDPSWGRMVMPKCGIGCFPSSSSHLLNYQHLLISHPFVICSPLDHTSDFF